MTTGAMTLRHSFLLAILAVSGLPTLTGCAAAPGAAKPDTAAYSSIDGQYAPALAEEYRMLAPLMQANGRGDIATLFYRKAGDAAAGRWAVPEAPAGEEAHMKAYDALTGALMFAMSPENALYLAKAQVNYDCWVRIPSEDGCQRNFSRAMQGLTLPEKDARVESVFFDDDSSVLNAGTHGMLEAIASQARMNKGFALRLKGHSGGGEQNQSLALRRAIAVRNVLAQMGVSPDRITVEGEGHSDTILSKQTLETGSDPKTHRVDITLEPVLGQAI